MDPTDYYEMCNCKTMMHYDFFLYKLKQIQKISKLTNSSLNSKIFKINNSKNNCNKCKITYNYQLSHIFWSDNLIHIIKKHHTYPSEYFIQIILNCCIIQNKIINPPIKIKQNLFVNFSYILFNHNKLLTLDALFNQGSYPHYTYMQNNHETYIFSEHFGVLVVTNKKITDIIISTINRIDPNDNNIYLPTNTNILQDHEYLFHTHPNTIKYGGRLHEGILYEFPSASDIYNFIKYYNEGNAQLSIVIAPEGMYIIRPIKLSKKINDDDDTFYSLSKYIIKLETSALNNLKNKNISEPDVFHKIVSSNMKYITKYNNFINKNNLYIEYYPRIKKNGEWYLRQVNLPYIEK